VNSARLRRPKSTYSPSYVAYRPKINAVVLLDMSHTLRGELYRRNWEREGSLKLLNVVHMHTVEEWIK
jgi:hypothetical protein